MKKQIITIASVMMAALILFTSYVIFFKDDGIEEVGDPFYTLTDDVKNALAEIEDGVTVTLAGYDGDDDGWEMIRRFAEAIAEANDEITVETTGGEGFVKIGERNIPYADFFKTLYNGTRYAFDGEALMVNAILSSCGKSELNISLRALEGYDTDGDTVTANGAPFVFPSVTRSEVSFLTITNEHGKYSIYQDEGDFYFGDSRAIEYNDEMFSQVTTNCRYPVAYGKMAMPEGKTWESYGLDSAEKATASYSLMTTAGSDGSYFLHTVYVGNISSTGNYYYARYIGGLFSPEKAKTAEESADESEESATEPESGDADKEENKENGDKLIHNLSKDIIYFLPVDTVEGSLYIPQTDIMKPTIVNAITNTEQLYSVDNIRIDLFGDNVSAAAKKLSDFNAASNLAVVDTTSISTVICDKKYASDYSSYSDGWYKHIDVFGAFTSSDGKSTYIDAALAKQTSGGEYKVTFGLLRDEANGAYLPSSVTFTKSYDGNNWHEIENGSVSISHSDKSLKRYEFTFNETENVKYIRMAFDVPQRAQTYVVMDEIRIYGNGEDLQPSSAIGGTWKLVAPKEYISEGMNYSFLDMSNFNTFVQLLCALEGEKVVACGFTDNGDASVIDKEILAKYGLDNPDKHFAFEFDGIVTDLYVSKPDKDGKYYAYSIFSGELNGEKINASTDVIVQLTTETASWLSWDIVEYLDHSLFSIYVVDISKMEITMDSKNYVFDLYLDSDGQLADVKYEGKSFDVKSFKYFYQSIISIYMQDEYQPSEGDDAEEYFRIKVHTETNSPEIVFYRVSSSRCYFTINGEGSYYALVEDVNEAREKLVKYINGEIITK